MQGVAPEAAARVYVNGNDAGGVIGEPLRIDVTQHVKPGKNDLKIEPFAPATVTLSFWVGRRGRPAPE